MLKFWFRSGRMMSVSISRIFFQICAIININLRSSFLLFFSQYLNIVLAPPGDVMMMFVDLKNIRLELLDVL